jgi:hypothetical protein
MMMAGIAGIVLSHLPPIEHGRHPLRPQLVEQLGHLGLGRAREHGGHALRPAERPHPVEQVPRHRALLAMRRHDLDPLDVREADQRPLAHDLAVVLNDEHLAILGGAERQELRELPRHAGPFVGRQDANDHDGLPPSTSNVTGTLVADDFR